MMTQIQVYVLSIWSAPKVIKKLQPILTNHLRFMYVHF